MKISEELAELRHEQKRLKEINYERCILRDRIFNILDVLYPKYMILVKEVVKQRKYIFDKVKKYHAIVSGEITLKVIETKYRDGGIKPEKIEITINNEIVFRCSYQKIPEIMKSGIWENGIDAFLIYKLKLDIIKYASEHKLKTKVKEN